MERFTAAFNEIHKKERKGYLTKYHRKERLFF